MSELFKVLNADGNTCNGGQGKWFLPEDGQPGEWMPVITGDLVPCRNGYHLCRLQDLLNWLGEAIFEAETRGERIDCDDKVVVREARLVRRMTNWNDCTARLFACDCAEHVLPIFEKKYPNERAPRQAIETARRYAEGQATEEELAVARDVAWAAARAAVRGVAWDVAWAAARAAVRGVAWDVARAAARAAARGVDRDADRDAEKNWQSERLAEILDL